MSKTAPLDASAAARALAARSNARGRTPARRAAERAGAEILDANRHLRHPRVYAIDETGRVVRLPSEARESWVAARQGRRAALAGDNAVRRALRSGAVLEILDSWA